jgi:hypothetical protein
MTRALDKARDPTPLGTAATLNTGTGTTNVPTTAEADARYAAQSALDTTNSNLGTLTTVVSGKAEIGDALAFSIALG